ncbi:membrane protein insertase YidC [Streptomyces agglomeratus]|uniref:Membrane protein insertase YidC n=1 Tax=Streptomyces agglomeratus TaxID=285458 RepID=A0A1E5P904_9ACTN|nr:membrane protein insertase YidC [Streptomyces agglomeratus]OEJ26022.1 membrane protein insertase YidC [Streptomyces agglomeratus]OEJ39922.1 membrane protein insertase YidC [Streptomyces agglomeratus]OEJ45698.1 membrane protein insertase YidC [Streptomyces agglomeratus]OEJ52470.1 membrane protein insertase YidC [Streptomyces agglomeratus]OEJ59842.1 membrane protein insertase YidC [Streptomyces agglomeratus]
MDTIASLFSFITTPVSWVIVQFHTMYGALFGPDTGWAWGLSIVSLVVLIRICLIPLFVKQIKSTRGMQALQPEMKKIQERYKNDKQRQSEEMMKLYKETGTNPLSSCLPILAQSPFFFALYHVLSNIASGKTVGVINDELLASAREAHIFGAPLAAKFTDSAAKMESLNASLFDVRVVTALMIILMSASQFYTQRQLMTKNVDLTVKTPFMQQQKMLMYIFPVMFAVMGINFPVGVLVYWLTTNVWTMGQQMYVIHGNPTPGSKAQAQLLERMQKSIVKHGKVRRRSERNVIKQIAAKGRERNEAERKFVKGLGMARLTVQLDGTVAKGEPEVEAEDGTTPDSGPKRQQPKRLTKAQRQAAAAESAAKPSLQKEEQDDKPKTAGKPSSGSARQAKSGQRKGQQRPKHPSKK